MIIAPEELARAPGGDYTHSVDFSRLTSDLLGGLFKAVITAPIWWFFRKVFSHKPMEPPPPPDDKGLLR